MKSLSLEQEKTAVSNKRIAAELAQGQMFEQGGRPNKLRCASTEDSHCRGLPLDPPSSAPSPDTSSSTSAFQLGAGPMARDRSSSTDPEMESPTSPPPSSAFDIILQPDTRPITQEQLVNEVKGIYAGLVMVEKKCVEVHCLSALILCIAY
jgi:hypothetical protein